MKVVINGCYGGFSLSPEALQRLYDIGMKEIATPVDEYFPPDRRAEDDEKYKTFGYTHAINGWREYKAGKREGRFLFLTVFTPDEQFVLNGDREVNRDDPRLIQIVEEMGEAANGSCANLRIVEIPDGTDYEVNEYDGFEHVAEKHRTWS